MNSNFESTNFPIKQYDNEQQQVAKQKQRSQFEEETEDTPTWLEILPQIIFVTFLVFVLIFAAYDIEWFIAKLQEFIEWVEIRPFVAAIAITGIYILMVILSFPVGYMSIALGYAFSQSFAIKLYAYLYGLVLISLAVQLGSILAFLISRYWLSKLLKRLCLRNPRSFNALNTVISREGWKTIFLMRLTPIPYSIVSYFLGLTNVKLVQYIIGSSSQSIHIAIELYIGFSLDHFNKIRKSTSNDQSNREFFLLSVEVVVAFIIMFYISFIAKVELDKQINVSEQLELATRELDVILESGIDSGDMKLIPTTGAESSMRTK